MGVEDSGGFGGREDALMQKGFCGSLAIPADHLTRLIHNDKVLRLERPFVDTTRSHEEAVRFAAEKGTEIATCAVTPTPPVDVTDHLAKCRGFR